MQAASDLIKFAAAVLAGISLWWGRPAAASPLELYIPDPKIGIEFTNEILAYLRTLAPHYGFELREGYVSAGDQRAELEQLFAAPERDQICPMLLSVRDVVAAQVAVERARKAQVPVIFIVLDPGKSVLDSYTGAWHVGTNRRLAGAIEAEIIKDFLDTHSTWDRNGNGVLDYVLLRGETEVGESALRSRVFKNTLTRLGIKAHILADRICDLNEELAAQQLEQYLGEAGTAEVEAVICNNDAQALGAVATLQQHGFNNPQQPGSFTIPVVGVDGTSRALECIASGSMLGTALQDPQQYAQVALQLLRKLIDGKDFDAVSQGVEFEGEAQLKLPFIRVEQNQAKLLLGQ